MALSSERKVLMIRLSSLGDVVLSSAALEAETIDTTDWVVAKEFAPLLEGHPKIRRLWVFDRKTGLKGWVDLWRTLWTQNYDEIYDLHRTIRTEIARLFFGFWLIQGRLRGKSRSFRWFRLSKERWRLYGYFLLKGFWPKKLRPRPVVERSALAVRGSGQEKPNLRHLLKVSMNGLEGLPADMLCVMPSARWPGKQWPAEKYLGVLQGLQDRRPELIPVILGTPQDHESVELVALLEQSGLPFVSGVGTWKLPQVAQVLSRSKGYLGSDTGLAHLAESLGVPAWMVFGPTVPDMGFGPWGTKSLSFGARLGCRPCGKDGRHCYWRGENRYLCMKQLSADEVLAGVLKDKL